MLINYYTNVLSMTVCQVLSPPNATSICELLGSEASEGSTLLLAYRNAWFSSSLKEFEQKHLSKWSATIVHIPARLLHSSINTELLYRTFN